MTIYFHSIKTLANFYVIDYLEPHVHIGGKQNKIQKPHVLQCMHSMAWVVAPNELQNNLKCVLKSRDVQKKLKKLLNP